jgi:arginase family enzyme
VVAHFTGRGAAELVRFWGEPPLVREPDITLFGLERIDPPEQEFLNKSPIRRVLAEDVQRAGAEKAAKDALEHLHAREFVLHFDTDVIAQEDFGAVPVPGPGGLRLNEVREALRVFASSKNLLAINVVEFNPEKDPDGSKAKLLVDLLAEVLAARLEALTTPAPAVEPAVETPETSSTGSAAS